VDAEHDGRMQRSNGFSSRYTSSEPRSVIPQMGPQVERLEVMVRTGYNKPGSYSGLRLVPRH
jgi:hypothetical protein